MIAPFGLIEMKQHIERESKRYKTIFLTAAKTETIHLEVLMFHASLSPERLFAIIY